MNSRKEIPFKKFKSDLFLGNYWTDDLFEYSLNLYDKTVTNIKIGENLTEEIFQFFILDFLVNGPSMKSINNSNSNFLILMERFLMRNFKRGMENEDLVFIKVSGNFNNFI